MLIGLALHALSQNLVSSFLDTLDKDSKKGITQVNISGTMLRLASKNDPNIDNEMKKFFENIDKISLISRLTVNDVLKSKLDELLSPYEELIQVIEENQTIRMHTKETKKQIEEFILYVLFENELTLMSITGKIDLKQIARLSESVKIQGVEHLNKVNRKK